eukprot:scaffold232687_cov21-Tisochrysis_lutea.AAC.1
MGIKGIPSIRAHEAQGGDSPGLDHCYWDRRRQIHWSCPDTAHTMPTHSLLHMQATYKMTWCLLAQLVIIRLAGG